jgi:hypothetical protein
MDSYGKAVQDTRWTPSSIAGAKQHATLPWCYTVRLPECKYCFRKEGYHTNSTVFYKVDLLSNKVFQSCHSPHCKGKDDALHEHTEGYFGDLFVVKGRLNLPRVMDLFDTLAERFAYKPPVQLLKELLLLKTEGQQTRFLTNELDRRRAHPTFASAFVDALMP